MTYVGATFSVLLKLFMLVFFIDGCQKLINKSKNDLNVETMVADFDEIGEIQIDEAGTGMLLFYVFLPINNKPFNYTESLRYFRYTVEHYSLDYSKSNKSE